MLIRLLTAATVLGALAAGAAAPRAFSSDGSTNGAHAHSTATAPTAPTAPTAAAAAPAPAPAPPGLSAHLRVSNRSPLQLHGVLLDASSSRGDIAQYVFDFGDGIVDRSYQPLALHGYRNPGTYRAAVTVVDSVGHQATSAAVKIRVRDGIPPVVRIDSPRPGQPMRLGRAGVLFRGVAVDSGGVSKVQLAVQLVSPTRQFKTHGRCVWYDAHQFLVLSNCSAPFFFAVMSARGRWSFRIPSTATIPAGTYVVRVRAIDRAGNISHFYSVRLRTILPFKLAR